MTSCKILDTGIKPAAKNMEIDRQLLESFEAGDAPILHFYEWQAPSATYGYFIKPQDFVNLAQAKDYGLDLARRPTGGGVIFHTCDLAFSFLVPVGHEYFSENTLQNYALVNKKVAFAIERFLKGSVEVTLFDQGSSPDEKPTFCMVKPTVYDVVIGGKKVAGAAQRKTRQALLHQGSICISYPQETGLLLNEEYGQMMIENSYPLAGVNPSALKVARTRSLLKRFLMDAFMSL